MQNLFLKEDRTKYEALIRNHERFIDLSKDELSKGKFDEAEKYGSHANDLIHEMRKLHYRKLVNDEADSIQSLNDNAMSARRNWF